MKPHGEQCKNYFYSNSFLNFKNNEFDIKNLPRDNNGAFSLSFISGQSTLCKHWNLICLKANFPFFSKWESVAVLFYWEKVKYRRAHKKAHARVQQIFTLSFAQVEQRQLIKNLTLKKYLWNTKPKRRLRLPRFIRDRDFLFAALFIFGFCCAA